MKLPIPSRKDRFRLVKDLATPGRPVLPAGTVFGVDSLKLNKSTSASSRVWCLIYVSPDPSLTMKKYGGTCAYGRIFSLTFDEARELEVELVEDMK